MKVDQAYLIHMTETHVCEGHCFRPPSGAVSTGEDRKAWAALILLTLTLHSFKVKQVIKNL